MPENQLKRHKFEFSNGCEDCKRFSQRIPNSPKIGSDEGGVLNDVWPQKGQSLRGSLRSGGRHRRVPQSRNTLGIWRVRAISDRPFPATTSIACICPPVKGGADGGQDCFTDGRLMTRLTSSDVRRVFDTTEIPRGVDDRCSCLLSLGYYFLLTSTQAASPTAFLA